MKKFRLYATQSEWDEKHDQVMDFVGIPDGKTTTYALVESVTNSSSSDYPKLIFPVLTSGKWQCDSLFDAADLQDWQADWFPNPPE
jgi:hypothetical protein